MNMTRREFSLSTAGGAAALAMPRAASATGLSNWERDAVWVEANRPDGHQFCVRVPLTFQSGAVSCQMLVGLSDVPRGNLEHDVFYGRDCFGDKQLHGFAMLYNTIDPEKAQNAINVLSGDSKSAWRSSIWIVGWNERAVHMITPDGQRPHGRITRVGLAVLDWRFVSRVANIDVADVLRDRDRVHVLLTLALLRLPKQKGATIYMGRAVYKAMGIKGGNYRNIPVRVVSALHDSEEIVT